MHPSLEAVRTETIAAFNAAVGHALARSKEYRCTVYVNAHVRVDAAHAPVVTYTISDWFTSDASVYSATNGEGERL